MKKRRIINISFLLIFLIFPAPFVKSQETKLTIDTIQNYNNWGWEVLVIKNQYITAGIVPAIGGNILQYDFGIDTFLLLEPGVFGQVYDSASGNSPFDASWGFGGLQTWPTPENWPPPPNLTYRAYSCTVESSNSDSVVVVLKSKKETAIFPGLQMERKITAYKNSTRFKVENTMINVSSTTLNYGMMNVNYVGSSHGSHNDYENFHIYFPVNKDVGIQYDPKSTSFIGEINPGIFTIEFKPSQGKVYAGLTDGWAGYVDRTDSQAYVRVFPIYQSAIYPDNNSKFEVYIQASGPSFMAMEVISPLKNLTANGGRYSFTDNLYSTKLSGTIYRANHAGAVMQKLTYDSLSSNISGKFGVFNDGYLKLSFYDKDYQLLATGTTYQVSPANPFILNEDFILPSNTNYIKLIAYKASGDIIDVLDLIDYSPKPVTSAQEIEIKKSKFIILDNVLETNGIMNCRIDNELSEFVLVNLIDYSGRIIANIFSGIMPLGIYDLSFQLNCISPGLYFVVFSTDTGKIYQKLIITN